MKYIYYAIPIIISYLYGSIPFALVIGQLFYHKDVREEGSHNLGGTNAGRVLGKKAGMAVILLDATKCIISILFARLFMHYFSLKEIIVYLSALSCIIGHCYPIFAQFKGGKGVSSAIAYALMTNIYAFLIAVAVFMITLKSSKYVSLSSILGCIAVSIAGPFIGYSIEGCITNILITLLIIYKHKENIQRLKNHNENKVSWL